MYFAALTMAEKNENSGEQDEMFAFDKEEGLGDNSPEHTSPKISPRDKKPKQQETETTASNIPLNPFMVAGVNNKQFIDKTLLKNL
jgi:hypothetical protein